MLTKLQHIIFKAHCALFCHLSAAGAGIQHGRVVAWQNARVGDDDPALSTDDVGVPKAAKLRGEEPWVGFRV